MEINDLSIVNITNGRIYLEAFNLQNSNLSSKMLINNFTTDNVNAEYSSLILINEGAELEIRDSVFKNIYCYEEGAIIFAGYQKSVTSIYDSVFINNTAVQGSLFNIESESVVKLYN
jgi:hypothetical protein